MSRLRRHWLLACVVIVVSVLAWLPVLETASIKQSEKGLERALTVYAAARAVNAVISFAQGTSVSVEPFGVGAELTVGEMLDPINDLVEQLSSLMLLASVAFGVQILLIQVGAHWVVALLLTTAAIGLFGLRLWKGRSPEWLLRLVVALVIVRFAVPAYALASEAVYAGFLASDYQVASQQFKRSDDALQAIERDATGDPTATSAGAASPTFFKRWVPSIPDFRKFKHDVARVAETSVKHAIDLIKLFAMQTVVLPLLFLWLLRALCRGLVLAPGRPTSAASTERGAA